VGVRNRVSIKISGFLPKLFQKPGFLNLFSVRDAIAIVGEFVAKSDELWDEMWGLRQKMLR
jgi:hypothetical protein